MHRSLALLALLFLTFAPAASAHQRDEGVTVYLHTIDQQDGTSLTDACYVLDGASLEGCDENGDGRIYFEDVLPGTYTVIQTEGIDDYLPVGAFPITVIEDVSEQSFWIEMWTDEEVESRTGDIAISPNDVTGMEPLSDSCFILYGGSLEGCDENGDGRIEFEDVPVGSYLVHQTRAHDGFQLTMDFWVPVDRDGILNVDQYPIDDADDDVLADVALVTRDPDTGDLLTGACYIIEGASIEGCDENGDGQVDYADVVPGTYTVTQTEVPAGNDEIDDFEISIWPGEPQSFLVSQSDEPYDPDFQSVSIVARDWDTGERLAGACFIIEGGSIEGCDENLDGQVDFLDVPAGEYSIQTTLSPPGYELYLVPNVWVFSEPGQGPIESLPSSSRVDPLICHKKHPRANDDHDR